MTGGKTRVCVVIGGIAGGCLSITTGLAHAFRVEKFPLEVDQDTFIPIPSINLLSDRRLVSSPSLKLAMSISRTLCRTRCYFPKNCTSAHFARPALLSIRTSIPWRQISTTARSWQETVQTPSRGVEGPLTTSTSEPAGSHARSVAILRVPKRATRPEIEELVRSKGLEMYVISEIWMAVCVMTSLYAPQRYPDTLQYTHAIALRPFHLP
jgi:hypothetical protein